MKKIIITAAAALFAMLASCSGKQSQKTDSLSDTIQIAMDSASEEARDSIAPEATDFVSDDLKALAIRGNVKERAEVKHKMPATYPAPVGKLSFSPEGKLTGKLTYAGTKNADGYYTVFSLRESDGTTWRMEYTSLDANGFPLKATIKEEGPMSDIESTLTYSDYKTDDKGNWTSRKVKAHVVEINIDNDEEFPSDHTWTETTSYTYY